MHTKRGPLRGFVWATFVTALASGCGSKSEQEQAGPPAIGPACTADPVTVVEPGSIDSIGDTLANGCAEDTGFVAWKSAAVGASCQSPTDCAPVCCQCGTAGREALTSWCDHGMCATAEQVCCALLGTSLHSCGAP